MNELLDDVRRTIRRFSLATRDTRVVVAVSGGSDSVALAHLTRVLHDANELRLVGLAHFNHQIRPAADADEQFCRELAASIDCPFVADREDVLALARLEGRSLEDAARAARHAFLERARLHVAADVVALGHTRDDQAETFLLRLLRGAGPRGLASMHPRRGTFVRPLLDRRREDLRAYLESRQIAWVDDESNDDVHIPRNRIRAELLPFLERFNPAIVDVLADEAEIARDTWRWLEDGAAVAFEQVCRCHPPDRWYIDVDGLRNLPLALARLVVHRAMTLAAPGRTIPFRHVEEVLQLSSVPRGALDAPGQRVERERGEIVLTSRPPGHKGRWRLGDQTNPANPENPENLEKRGIRYPLPVPGEVALPGSGCAVSAEEAYAAAAAGSALLGSGPVAVVQRDHLDGPLWVRNRRPGDRFQPLGLGGLKKLQDFFVDRKVARKARQTVPIVVDGRDRIVWVAGYTLDDAFRVTNPAEAVIILRLKVLGGPA